MSERYPRIRLHDEMGRLVIRDGLHISFFMNHSHTEVAPAAIRTIEAYRSVIGPEALKYYLATEEGPLDLDDKGWALLQHLMLNLTRDTVGCMVHLHEDLRHVGGFHVNYHGRKLDHPLLRRWPGAASAISFRLPTEYLEEHGPEAVRRLALLLAAELPFNSGYASLAFNAYDWGWSAGSSEIKELSSRYTGLDVHDLDASCRTLGTRIRGAYWLNFLGQPALGELGGAEGLRARLSSAIAVETLAPDKVLVQVGEWPQAGEVDKGEDMSLYRELARVLEPCLYQNSHSLYHFSSEDLKCWLRRFLD